MEGDNSYLVIFLVVGVVIGFISMKIWTNKGGSNVVGFLLGFLLGLIGLIIVAVAKPSGGGTTTVSATNMRECPYCKQAMRRDASVCPHCQRESPPWTYHEGRWWYRDEQGTNFYLDQQTNQWVRYG